MRAVILCFCLLSAAAWGNQDITFKWQSPKAHVNGDPIEGLIVITAYHDDGTRAGIVGYTYPGGAPGQGELTNLRCGELFYLTATVLNTRTNQVEESAPSNSQPLGEACP